MNARGGEGTPCGFMDFRLEFKELRSIQKYNILPKGLNFARFRAENLEIS